MSKTFPKLTSAVVFENYGPYHIARVAGAQAMLPVRPVQIHQRSETYAWHSDASRLSGLTTLLPGDGHRDELFQRLSAAWDEWFQRHPVDVLCVNGWGDLGSLITIQAGLKRGLPLVVMSESSAADAERSRFKEAIKRRIVGLASAGLVGGSRHADYLAALGMPRERIFLGYDAVDNQYFADAKCRETSAKSLVTESGSLDAPSSSDALAPRRSTLNAPYFLASARFVEKKNLPFLLRAYARYRKLMSSAGASSDEGSVSSTLDARPSTAPWRLVLLGDGPLRAALDAQLSTLDLRDSVAMPGFIQYPELPLYYAGAGAFVHASTTEQWGLVVNEAMASGLPVLVSNRCGCAPDLVRDGVNGWTFDPTNEEQLAGLMLRLSTLDASRRSSLCRASAEIISTWGPERFAEGLRQAAECAVRVGPKRAGLVDRALLAALARR